MNATTLDLNTAVSEIVRYMAGDWNVRHTNLNGGEIFRSDDYLTLFFRRYGNKLTVLYVSPVDLDGCAAVKDAPIRQFTATRPLNEIAYEVQERFLPEIFKLHAVALARVAEANKRIEEMRRLRGEFCETLGVKGIASAEYSFRNLLGDSIVAMQINSPDSITINLQALSAEKARAILKILKS